MNFDSLRKRINHTGGLEISDRMALLIQCELLEAIERQTEAIQAQTEQVERVAHALEEIHRTGLMIEHP